MKTNRKIIIPSLAVLVGASLAGSVTGTIAWFQYATRATVALTGASAHCSKMLEVSLDDGDEDITNNVWNTDIGNNSIPLTAFSPVTTGGQKKNEEITIKTKQSQTEFEQDGVTPKTYSSQFYKQPIPNQGLYPNWLLAEEGSYAQFTLLVRVKDVNEKVNTNSPDLLINDLYLTDLLIQDATSNGELDLSNSVRVHFAIEDANGSKQYLLFSKEDTSIDVGGFLDVDNNGELDYDGYQFNRSHCLYGGGTQTIERDDVTGAVISETLSDLPTQTSYSVKDEKDPTSENYNNIFAKEVDGNLSGGLSLGKTSNSSSNYLKITVTVWLEGWATLQHGATPYTNASSSAQASSSEAQPATPSKIWDSAAYTNKSFNVGMTFGVKLHSSEDHA